MNSLFKESLEANTTYFAIIIIFFFLVLLGSFFIGFPLNLKLYNFGFLMLIPAMCVSAFVASTVYSIATHRPKMPLQFLYRIILPSWQIPKRIALGLPIIIILPFFFSVFTSLKSGINSINPFYADDILMKLDQFIHGQAAWKVLHPILGYPYITIMINFVYNFWFFVFYSTLILCAFMIKRPRLRAQFLISFALCWIILGGFFAIMFASVGPCFYSAFYADDPFKDLMAYLNRANEIYPIWTLTGQQALLQAALKSEVTPGAGISAMPSLHVSVAMLIAIFFWQLDRRLGWLGIAFFLMISLGSVHLAWHYAVDAYFSIILTPVIWVFSGHLAKLSFPQRTAEPLPASGHLPD